MIDFPLNIYPLDDSTRLIDDNNTIVDRMDDGGVRLRTLGAETFRNIRCVIQPMDSDASAVFEQYMRDNRAEQFNITYKSVTYRGYVSSKVKPNYIDGDIVRPEFDFIGQVI